LVLNAPRLVLHANEVVEVAIERRDEVPDDRAPDDDVLVTPGRVGIVRIGPEVLVADVQPTSDCDAPVGLSVDDPHFFVEALVERVGVGVRDELRHRNLVQPLQRHRLVALDLDAVLLEVEIHPLRLQPGIREGIHDDAHVEAGGLLLLEDLRDAQSALVALEHERLDPNRASGILQCLETNGERILAALQHGNLAAFRAVHRKQPVQADVWIGAAGESSFRPEH
jgi:hypothetical protein